MFPHLFLPPESEDQLCHCPLAGVQNRTACILLAHLTLASALCWLPSFSPWHVLTSSRPHVLTLLLRQGSPILADRHWPAFLSAIPPTWLQASLEVSAPHSHWCIPVPGLARRVCVFHPFLNSLLPGYWVVIIISSHLGKFFEGYLEGRFQKRFRLLMPGL